MESSVNIPIWLTGFKKYSARMMYLLGMTSLPWIISMLMFYFKTSRYLGYNPGYNHPDPKELSFYNDYNKIIDVSGGIWILSLMVWVILVIVTLIITRKQIDWKPVLISFAGHALGVLVFISGIMEWYGD